MTPPYLALWLVALLVFTGRTDLEVHATSYGQAQAPLNSPGSNPWIRSWDFDAQPSLNTTHNLVFDSVSSLLQQWPNTRYRNGHTIVPGTIPVGTLLHHGTSYRIVPSTPEWTALDPEFSYMFCHTLAPGTGCWHLTLIARRELKVLYFDGGSAVKTWGAVDAQDLVVDGEVDDEKVWDDAQRLGKLCEWGKKYDFDGFARLQSSIEIMLCDFTAGLEVVSFLNLASELSPPPSDNSTGAYNIQPTIHFDNNDPDQPTLQKVYHSIEAGLWHSGPFGTSTPGGPSESRVRLDLARLVSFYDTDLFPSLVEARWRSSEASRVGANRVDDESANDLTDILFHRAQRLRGSWRVGRGISKADQSNLVRRLDDILRSDTFGGKHGSGVDWASLMRIIKDRYSDRLENLHHVLHGLHGAGDSSPIERLRQVHWYIDGMLTPYILNGVRPQVPSTSTIPPTANHSWAVPILRECATTHVRSLYVLKDGMTRAEVLLLEAASGVLHEICRTLVGLWAQGIETGLDLPSSSLSHDFTASHDVYAEKITSLIVWLDWSAWFKCRNPTCTFEETCYLPTWPFFHNLKPGLPGVPPRRKPDWGDPDDTSEWDFPRPRCYRRLSPFMLP